MLIACVPACVRSYSYKGATKKKQIKTKKIVFFACVFKKKHYLWFIINIKTNKKMEVSSIQLIYGLIGSALIVAFSIIYVNLKK